MTFQANIPLPTDLISNSQSDILNNFQAIGTVYPTDHVNFNASGAGFHQKVTFNATIADPNQTSPIATAYTKPSSVSSISDLYYQNGSLASNVVQLTGGGITAAAYAAFIGSTAVTLTTYNAAVVRVGLGSYQINFSRQFSSTNYLPMISANGNGSVSLNFTQWNLSVPGTFTFEVVNQAGAHVDPGIVSCLFFGTLA